MIDNKTLVLIDKNSGKNLDRSELNKMMLNLKLGDNLYVETISHLRLTIDDLKK